MNECPLGHDKDESQPCSVCAEAWQRFAQSGHGYPTVNTRVFCAHCEHNIDNCPACGKDEWRIAQKVS